MSYKIMNIVEALKKQDVKATERKMEKEVIDVLDNNEINFINNFIKKGEKIDGKTYKSVDALINKYKKKIGQSKVRTDTNLQLLAPIIASMYITLKD